MTSFVAAVLQLNGSSDVERNFAQVVEHSTAAVARGAQLVATPENTNYLGPHREKVGRAEPLDGPTIRSLRRAGGAIAGALPSRVLQRSGRRRSRSLRQHLGVVRPDRRDPRDLSQDPPLRHRSRRRPERRPFPRKRHLPAGRRRRRGADRAGHDRALDLLRPALRRALSSPRRGAAPKCSPSPRPSPR